MQENKRATNLFVYPSMLRMLNFNDSKEFNLLIKDLEHLHFVTELEFDSGDDELDKNLKNAYLTLSKKIEAEGYEELLSVDNQGFSCTAYEVSETKGLANLIMVVNLFGNVGLIEMKGGINLKYLTSLEEMENDKLKKYLNSTIRTN